MAVNLFYQQFRETEFAIGDLIPEDVGSLLLMWMRRNVWVLEKKLLSRGGNGWQLIGDNRDLSGVPGWVITALAREPGSHGTRLIDYPEPGQLYYKGRTYRYRIDMGWGSWKVYRKMRHRLTRRLGLA